MYDIANPEDHQRVRDQAEDLLGRAAGQDELLAIGRDAANPLDLRVASKLAASRQALLDSGWAGRLGVTIAMWGERRRLHPRTDDNPTGEDSLHVKLDQLGWLFDGTDVDWAIYCVDDGDPEDSASVAEERAADHPRGDRVTVARLADALGQGPLSELHDVDDSRKGGAIVYGAHLAMTDGRDAVVMTDADNSVDLGQIGLLIGRHAAGSAVVVGDRKDADSVLVKAEARWGPGIVVLRHMQRMVGVELFSRGLQDTQAAFKLYSRPVLETILAKPSTYGFAFDSDWLYAAVMSDVDISAVPFAFIDSFEESASITQGPMTTWESLLKGLVMAARWRGVPHDEAMAQVVDRCGDAATLELVVQNVPDELAQVPADRLGDPTVMPPADVETWIESLRATS
ncbi:MAG: glycosyltransferase [Actinomycetota bacterium]